LNDHDDRNHIGWKDADVIRAMTPGDISEALLLRLLTFDNVVAEDDYENGVTKIMEFRA